MTAKNFVVQKATFDVASDGTSFRMNFICRDGSQVSLSLPTECLHGFMMTLPKMMRQAAPGPKRSREPTSRLSGRQPTLRAFHRTGRFHRDSDDDGGFRSVVRSHTATDDGFRGCRRRHLARRIPITTRHSIGGSIKS